ncbi:MAG: hypothetical protein JWR10_1546 [Rubritepida sp.]|nr:hypothetical protein [Rubritepida sp.]
MGSIVHAVQDGVPLWKLAVAFAGFGFLYAAFQFGVFLLRTRWPDLPARLDAGFMLVVRSVVWCFLLALGLQLSFYAVQIVYSADRMEYWSNR